MLVWKDEGQRAARKTSEAMESPGIKTPELQDRFERVIGLNRAVADARRRAQANLDSDIGEEREGSNEQRRKAGKEERKKA